MVGGRRRAEYTEESLASGGDVTAGDPSSSACFELGVYCNIYARVVPKVRRTTKCVRCCQRSAARRSLL